MLPYKMILVSLAVILSAIGYYKYFKGIFASQTKPHAFSWFIWSLLTGTAFAVVLTEKGGPGAWSLGFTALACFAIFILALVKGDRKFALFDWICLTGALSALILWRVTSNPVLAIVLVIITDGLGFLPTFRKAFYKPLEEVATTYTLDAIKHSLSILALSTYSPATWMYPAFLVIADSGLALMLLFRRKQISFK